MALTAAKEIFTLRKKLADYQDIAKRQREHIERLNRRLETCQEGLQYFKDQTERLSLDLGLKK